MQVKNIQTPLKLEYSLTDHGDYVEESYSADIEGTHVTLSRWQEGGDPLKTFFAWGYCGLGQDPDEESCERMRNAVLDSIPVEGEQARICRPHL